MYKYMRVCPEFWEAAKQICKAKHESMIFNTVRQLKKYVKDNKQYIPDVVESGVCMGWAIKL